MSGFTGSGYPKSVPLALAARMLTEALSWHQRFIETGSMLG